MSSWQTFLIIKISSLYGLSRTEQKILLAKFPNPDTLISNKDVAKQLIGDDGEESDRETVRRQMWTIYNDRFCPTENRDGFPAYNQQGSQAKDKEFLAWLKQKYSVWLKSQPPTTIINNHANNHFVTNPFIPLTGRIDDPQLLFGREQEIREIFEILNSGSSVALIGEREIGKSSILKAICQLAEKYLHTPRKPIYLNLHLISDDDKFYHNLCDEIGISVNNGYRLSRELQKHKLLLVLDELEKMTWDGFTSEVRGQLRGLAEGSNAPLRLVVAACTPLNILFPDSQKMPSPFQGICHDVNIDSWDKTTCSNFITDRLAKTSSKKVSFTTEEIEQIITQSGGHPRKLMQLCYQTYSRYTKDEQ